MPNSNNVPWKRISVEGAAIVVSILLAFSIDAWWQDRNELEHERRLLTALLIEFEQNGDLLRQARGEYEQRYMDTLQLLEIMDGGPAEFDEAEFARLLGGLLWKRSFHLESGAHVGLLASGELSLIRDESLRSLLAAWPSYVAEWSEEQDAVFAYVDATIVPHLSGWIRVRNVSRAFPPFPDGEPPPPIPVGRSGATSMLSLSTSVEFENLVYQRAHGTWHAMRDGETLRAQLSAIVELIKRNLDEQGLSRHGRQNEH